MSRGRVRFQFRAHLPRFNMHICHGPWNCLRCDCIANAATGAVQQFHAKFVFFTFLHPRVLVTVVNVYIRSNCDARTRNQKKAWLSFLATGKCIIPNVLQHCDESAMQEYISHESRVSSNKSRLPSRIFYELFFALRLPLWRSARFDGSWLCQ